MTIKSAPFTPWTPKKPASKSRPSRNDADLLARLDAVGEIAGRAASNPTASTTPLAVRSLI